MIRGGGGVHQEIIREIRAMERRLEKKMMDKFEALLYMPPEMRPFALAQKEFNKVAVAAANPEGAAPNLAHVAGEEPQSLEADL